MKNLNVNNIVEAKAEYTKQLRSVLVEPIYNKIIATYGECNVIENENNDKPVNVLIEMQKKMREIPYWNTYNIESLTRDVTKDCPYLSDLLAAVFVSNVKILTSIRMNKTKKVQLKMPSNENFVHTTMINVAEHVFNNPRIFKQDPLLLKSDMSNIINDSIDITIRTLLPIQNILQNYVGGEDDSSDDSSESGSDGGSDPRDDDDADVGSDDENAGIGGDDDADIGGDDENAGIGGDDENAGGGYDNDGSNEESKGLDEGATSNDFFDNEHETKKVQIQDKQTFRESPFNELPDAKDD